MLIKILTPLAVLFLAAPPDEGQWLPTQLREMDWDALEARGMELTKDEFWHPEKGGVLSAAVHINGCTASFVSKDGLAVTNHHCGFGAVAALSTVEANHLEKGFVAESRDQELPAPGVVVKVLKKIVDVTEQVHAAQAEAEDDLARWAATQRITAQLERAGQEAEPNTECQVAEYLEGREYHLIFRTVLPDVRLVYAPPRAIGEFGGEVDNWEWPRHTGDFCFFRAYVAPDGSPAAHAEENVPYQPEHYLKVSKRGVEEGDLAIIMGYPGSTQRYRTSTAVQDFEGFVYPKRKDILDRALAVLHAAGENDPALALTLSSPIKSMANVQKNAEGMVWGLARNAVVHRKLREEAEFKEWVNADAGRAAEFGDVLDDMLALDAHARETQAKDFALSFTVGYAGRQIPLLQQMVRACEANLVYGRFPPQLRGSITAPELTAHLESIQKPLLRIVVEELMLLEGDQRLAGTQHLEGEVDAIVEAMLSGDIVTDPDARAAAVESPEAVAASEHPLVVLARGLAEERRAYFQRNQERDGRNLLVGQKWIEAQQQWRGKTFYPDANSTLRVSIAEVKSYSPRDGVHYVPNTTVAGILAKHTGEEPFNCPPALLEAARTRAGSAFFDPRLGDVPVCFLTNGDTTGGNSGSPVVNGRGELIGLNFDRVFENVSGDFGWNPDRSRNISVDIRYVLWVIESVMPSPALLAELELR